MNSMRELLDELKLWKQSKIANDYGVYQDKLEKASPALIEALEICLEVLDVKLDSSNLVADDMYVGPIVESAVAKLDALAREVGK